MEGEQEAIIARRATSPEAARRVRRRHCSTLLYGAGAVTLRPAWLSWLERRSHIFCERAWSRLNPEVASSILAAGMEVYCTDLLPC